MAGSGYGGECWAIEAELTPKPLARTAAIMAGLLARTADYQPAAPPGPGPRYHRVVYLASPAARSIVDRAAAAPARRAAVTAGGAGPARGGGAVMWWYLRARLMVWLLRLTGRVLRWAVLAAVLVAAAPVSVVAGVGFAGAWLRGWPPAKLRRAACWSLPMTGVYLAGRALQVRTWQALALAPVRDWRHAWHLVAAGRVVTAFVLCAPVAVPAGLFAAAGLWAWRIYAIENGLSGKTATAPVGFDARQWRRAARAARGRVTAPGTFPLADRRGQIVMGATIRAVGHRWRPVTAVPYARDEPPSGDRRLVGVREDESDDADLGGLVRRRPGRPLQPRRAPAAADRAGLQGRPRRPHQSRPHPHPAAWRRGWPGGDLAR